MIKKTIRLSVVFFFIGGIMAGSWFFSRRVYVFYNGVYYGTFRRDAYKDYVDKAGKLMKDGKYDKFTDLIDRIITSYPHPYEAYRLLSEYYYSIDENEKGLAALMNSYDRTSATFEDVSDLVRKLYSAAMFGDVIGELGNYDFRGNSEFEFYFGASLCEQGKYGDALGYLDAAAAGGNHAPDLFYYRALSYYRLSETDIHEKDRYLKNAELNAESAFMKDTLDVRYKKLLLLIYNSQGKYVSAAKISRDMIK